MEDQKSSKNNDHWTESETSDFMKFAWAFVPNRDEQLEIISSLVPAKKEARVVDLCAGDGSLSQAILERHPTACVKVLDGSAQMLQAAKKRLDPFHRQGRVKFHNFNLGDYEWRDTMASIDCVVSSLAIHHLSDKEKALLYKDLGCILAPGGRLVIADLIEPLTSEARDLFANQWEKSVEEISQKKCGDCKALDAFHALEWNHFSDPSPDPLDQPAPLYSHLKWMYEANFFAVDVHWLRAGHAIFSGKVK